MKGGGIIIKKESQYILTDLLVTHTHLSLEWLIIGIIASSIKKLPLQFQPAPSIRGFSPCLSVFLLLRSAGISSCSTSLACTEDIEHR